MGERLFFTGLDITVLAMNIDSVALAGQFAGGIAIAIVAKAHSYDGLARWCEDLQRIARAL